MPRSMVVNFQSGNPVKWTPEKNETIIALSPSAGVLVTTDPAATFANVVAPAADGLRFDILAFAAGWLECEVAIPAGQSIFFAPAGAGGFTVVVLK